MYEDWEYWGEAGTLFAAEIREADFDPYLYLLDDNCEILTQDDDGGVDLLSYLEYELPYSGVYTLVVTSFGEVGGGNYLLDAIQMTPDL